MWVSFEKLSTKKRREFMKYRIKTAFILLLFFLPAAFLLPHEKRAEGKIIVKSHAGKKVDFICDTTLNKLIPVLQNLNNTDIYYTDILKRIQQKQKTIIIDRTHAIEIVKKIKINRLKYFTNNTNIQTCSLSIDHGRGRVTINGIDPLADVCIQSDDRNCAISATDGSYVINVNSPGTHTFTYHKCGYQTQKKQHYISGSTQLDPPPATLPAVTNQSREICGIITWTGTKPECVEVTLYRVLCAPAFYDKRITCFKEGSTQAPYSFGQIPDADSGTYMVEITGSNCTCLSQNCDNIVIPSSNNEKYQCNINCP
jgi:hypothetical protein